MSGPVYYLLALIFLLLFQIRIPITSASSAPGSYRACNHFRAWHQQTLFTWDASTSDTQQLVLFSFRVQFKFHLLTEAFPNNPTKVVIWSFSITSPYLNLLNSIPLSDLLIYVFAYLSSPLVLNFRRAGTLSIWFTNVFQGSGLQNNTCKQQIFNEYLWNEYMLAVFTYYNC